MAPRPHATPFGTPSRGPASRVARLLSEGYDIDVTQLVPQAHLERSMAKEVTRRDEACRSDAPTRLDHLTRALGAQENPRADGRDLEAAPAVA